MASLAGAVRLTAPTVPLFAVAVVIALLAVAARFLGIDVPWVSQNIAETLMIAFAILAAGVVFKGI